MVGGGGGGQTHPKKARKKRKKGPSFQNHEKPNPWGWGQSIAYL